MDEPRAFRLRDQAAYDDGRRATGAETIVGVLDTQIAAMENMNKVGAQIQDITDANLLALRGAVGAATKAPQAARRKAA